jgi:uncharacterized protein YyaL (SSP411 family)
MQQRNKRIRPSLDDKTLVIVECNGIQGLTDALQGFGETIF